MAEAPSRTATYVGAALVVAALVAAAITGFDKGSILGAVIALVAVIPAGVGMWKGMQEKTQAGLGLALLVFFAALGVAGLLVILKIVDWIR
jgi:predicted histidine transporter YuiF (NhaC family)